MPRNLAVCADAHEGNTDLSFEGVASWRLESLNGLSFPSNLI